MENRIIQIKKYLYKVLSGELNINQFSLLENELEHITHYKDDLKVYQLFARIPYLIGKSKIKFTKILLEEASCIRQGWHPENLRTDQAARLLLLLSIPEEDPIKHKKYFQNFFETSDINELETLCLGMPLYPYAHQYTELVRFALRSNMKIIFESIALNNPYPAEYFDINAWNQMVLKALFIGTPIYKIYGIEERANTNLSRMAGDYAHERWAAGRTVSPEIWRLMANSISENIFKDFQRISNSNDELQKEAAVLACLISKDKNAAHILNLNPELKNKIIREKINWADITERWNNSKAAA